MKDTQGKGNYRGPRACRGLEKVTGDSGEGWYWSYMKVDTGQGKGYDRGTEGL